MTGSGRGPWREVAFRLAHWALAMSFLPQYPFQPMALSKATWVRLLAASLLVAVVALLGLGLLAPQNPFGAGLQCDSYDLLHSFSPAGMPKDAPVVIVYLDRASYQAAGLDPLRRWPRELHAQLLRRLHTAGARAVVFDIIFDTAGDDPAADAALAAGLRDSGRVILAAEHHDKVSHKTAEDQVWTRTTSFRPPYELFAQAAAGWGVASLAIDDDLTVRRFLAGFTDDPKPALAWATASFLHLPLTQADPAMRTMNGRWIHYYGPSLAVPHVSFSEALDPAGLPDDFFRDKIVVVGARPMESLINERRDEFRSPFHSWNNKEFFMPGVEVHATELLNLLRGDWLQRPAPESETAIMLFVALLFGGGLVWLRPIPATMVSVAGAALALGLSVAGFSRGVWFPWLIVSAAQIPAALGGSVLFYSVEWYRARKRFEAAKKIADAKIREQAALIDKAHDAILVQSLAGVMVYANRAAERLYGWRLDELQRGDCVSELFLPDAAAAQTARARALQDGEWNGELKFQTRAGQMAIAASRWTLIRDEAGRPRELLLINSDITEQKQLEAQLLRTQRMNTIGTLAGGMAHDLNNALAPILMGAQLLRRKATDDETRNLLGMMETNTQRGADMVRQVLLFARGRGGEFERVEPAAVVRELERMVRETFPKNIAVESFLPKDLWPVSGNPTQLHQVLLNLSVNARDAMPSGGKLSFVADNVELSAAEAAALPDGTAGEFVSLSVSDSGTGMTPEVQARIFEPFFTTKGEERGTGIGLATVFRIVKAHQGFLRVASEPGQGTTFEVFLPRASAGALPSAVPSGQALPRGHSELILVADDEKAIRELMHSELTAFGYRVLTAADGSEAVALFRRHAGEVRLLITDHAMPVMDGRQAIAEVRTLRPTLPVIFTSGEEAAGPFAGVTMLSKPFALEDLLGAIHRNLNPPP